MYLRRLTLQNFRCYNNIEIGFREQLSVIIGTNGTGKTTILEAAAIALGTMFVGMDKINGRNIDKNSDALRKTFTIGDTVDVQKQYPVEITAFGTFGNMDLEWRRRLNGSKGNTTIKDAKLLTNFGYELQKRVREGDESCALPLIAYYGTGRLWDYHRQKKYDVHISNSRLNGYLDCLDGTANIKLMLDWFKKMTIEKYQRQEEKLHPNVALDVVYSAMEKCFELATGFKDIKIRYNLKTYELDVYYTDGERKVIPLNQLSDGYKGTISLIADIAYRMAILNPQLGKEILKKCDGIVLIDEVDLHLHPEWQQRILKDLINIFPKLQFIVTTHAPAVVNTVKRDSLIMLNDAEYTLPNIEVYGKDVNSVLSGVMNSSERPIEIKELFLDFYNMLDENNLCGAKNILCKLRDIIGEDDPEYISCLVKLDLEFFLEDDNDKN